MKPNCQPVVKGKIALRPISCASKLLTVKILW